MSAISDGLQFGAAAVAVLGAGGGAYKYGVRRWKQTIGRRRTQTAILDELTCDVSLEYIESKLGLPLFITYPDGNDGYEERVYRLPGAWVTVQPVNGAVRAFSITITDPEMYYDIGPMTGGSIELDLGRDTFAKAPPSDDEALNIGPRWASFVRYYSYGGVAGNRFYYLAFNGLGTGAFHNTGSSYGTSISGGSFGTPPDFAKITANTLTVVSPNSPQGDMQGRDIHGPHHDLLWLPSENRRARSQRRGVRGWLRRIR